MMADRYAHLTESQRLAIRTTDRSVLVSAAAGSGKTTVLAERCAALVCDLPAERRCGIDELLVVTFTEAAATEMRSRIGAAIRQRLSEDPRDGHLQRQLHTLDCASISTIHAFCRNLILRWFPQAGVDPQAAVLAGDEALLLRQEVLAELFGELYGGSDDLSRMFHSLVDDYGGGDDTSIAPVVLGMHEYVNSLPDPEGWLSAANRWLDPAAEEGFQAGLHERQRRRLADELSMQIEYAGYIAAAIERCWPVARLYIPQIQDHADRLREWHDALSNGPVGEWQSVASEIADHAFPRAPNRPRSLSEADKAACEAAKNLREDVKKVFESRLAAAMCGFTAEEYREGLVRIAPYVRTLTELVRLLEQRYRDAKSSQAAVDFNDLQRGAFRLLAEDGDPRRPSAIARRLQQTYAHVLVDEFQDVDPLQAAILRLVSREPADPPSGNLFAVGDIKQSIYRFRLAEPRLFAERAEEFSAGSSIGTLIHLQENFRSRPDVIEAINRIFRPLMRKEFGDSDYGEADQLNAKAVFPQSADAPVFLKPAVEVHLLEPKSNGPQAAADTTEVDEQDDRDDADDRSPADELENIERAAYVIARRIRQWMGDNPQKHHWHVTTRPQTPGGPPTTRPIEYRDIVILLRSLPHKASPIAEVLRRMGIPVEVGRDDQSFDTTEFRDVLSLLRLLDNRQQDVPLAAVLRSPLLQDRLNETDLVTIRLLNRDAPFHAAAARYAEEGPDQRLRDRLQLMLARLDHYRERIRHAPVADVLWEIYEETGYLAFVSGLPNGLRRREHLVRLHELARRFGQFARQGLGRFLRFVEEMVEREQPPQGPAVAGADDNVVRIMTVHASKGLEFPVVILADLQKKFNLNDLRGPVLVDRRLGIGMRAADPERRIMYPTLAHELAVEHGRRETLAEELRLLYVALTRAREHLVLVGQTAFEKIAMYRQGITAGPLPRLELEKALSPLAWLLPVLGTLDAGDIDWCEGVQGSGRTLFEVHTYPSTMTGSWRVPAVVDEASVQTLAHLADLQPLPGGEPVADGAEANGVIETLSYEYPALELTTLPARVSITELKRRWDPVPDPDERSGSPPRRATQPPRPRFIAGATVDNAAARGMATHRFCQLIDLSRSCDGPDLDSQCRALVLAGRLTHAEADGVSLDDVAWFFGTDLGRRMGDHVIGVRREVAFVSRIDPQQYDPLVKQRDAHDVLLVRGVVDVLLREPSGLQLLDYKTDRIRPEEVEARAADYRPQIAGYARAMSLICRQPVNRAWLVFLHARRIVEVRTGDASSARA